MRVQESPRDSDAAPSQSDCHASVRRRVEVVAHMMDWNNYRRELSSGVAGLGKLSPETVRAYVTMSGPGQGPRLFDDKTRELIAIAVAITLRCDGCLAVHAEAARKHGATKAEIAEAMGVAVSVNAGAAIVYSTRALDAFDAAVENSNG